MSHGCKYPDHRPWISGAFLAHFLDKAGVSFVILDESRDNSASRAAAGLINPVTGRRIVKTWMIDQLMPFAKTTYEQIGKELSIQCFDEKKIVDFFPTPQMRNAFIERFESDPQFLQMPKDENDMRELFHYPFGYGEIHPVYLVQIPALLSASRKKLIESGKLLDAHVDLKDLVVQPDKIVYKEWTAERIIFCDGIVCGSNPYFGQLPFAPNKGEALVIEIKDFPVEHIFKKGLGIVPLAGQHYWVGASYEWDFLHDQPTETFRKRTELTLLEWLKIPFKIVDHFASVRPATLERRPFVGFHPKYKNLGILNGMGSKGCSLAPYFAKQLTDKILGIAPLAPEADVLRFEKILSREPMEGEGGFVRR